VERHAIIRRAFGKPVAQGLYQRLLDRGCAPGIRPRFLQGRPGRLATLRRQESEVDVRPVGVRYPPPGHRAVWIESRGLLERPDRLIVIECVKKNESLIEIPGGGWIACGNIELVL